MELNLSLHFPPPLRLKVEAERLTLTQAVRITGYVIEHQDVVVVTLTDGEHQGRGEAAGVYYHGDDPARLIEQIESVRPAIEAGTSRDELKTLLPPGGARNALDCALWDLEAQRLGRPAWALAGFAKLRPLLTTYTVSADSPDVMASHARGFAEARAIKLKLTGEPEDRDRVKAVRAARPDVWIGVDGNQGFSRESLAVLMPVLVEANVSLLEQPFPLIRDEWLDGLGSPIPIAADESVQGLTSLAGQVGRAQVINIKLDKCGGLTEAMEMAYEARRMGFGLMVGNMLGTVLAMAPAMVVGQLCEIVDLDGPIPLVRDRSPATEYREGRVWCPPEAWGGGVVRPELRL